MADMNEMGAGDHNHPHGSVGGVVAQAQVPASRSPLQPQFGVPTDGQPEFQRKAYPIAKDGIQLPANPEQRKPIQERLFLLLHTKMCLKRDENGELCMCAVPQCKAMKDVFNHTTIWCEGKDMGVCSYPHCTSSELILSHWMVCTRMDCPLCHLPMESASVIVAGIPHRESCSNEEYLTAAVSNLSLQKSKHLADVKIALSSTVHRQQQQQQQQQQVVGDVQGSQQGAIIGPGPHMIWPRYPVLSTRYIDQGGQVVPGGQHGPVAGPGGPGGARYPLSTQSRESLQRLLQVLRSPNSPEQLQQVLQILRSDPELITAFIKQRQEQHPGGQQQVQQLCRRVKVYEGRIRLPV